MIINIKRSYVVWLFLFLLAGCGDGSGVNDHGHAHDNGAAHAHGEGELLVYTDYTEQTELFVEFPPLIAGQASTFVAHVTRLADYEPLTSGTLDVVLSENGNSVARFRVRELARTGIFTPAVTPRDAGEFVLAIHIKDGDLQARHELGRVQVFENGEAASVDQPQVQGDINYLKEQQWVNPFAAELAEQRLLRPSVPGFATVLPPADASAVMPAAADGYYSNAELVTAGKAVEKGQVLGYLVPRLGEGSDIGELMLALERARSQLNLAERDVQRLQGLFEQGAVPERRLIEAREALEVAQVEMRTAQSRIEQQQGSREEAGIALRAPVNGEITSSNVRPGAFVRAGDVLFTIADPTRRWLEVQVPERYAHSLAAASGVWFSADSTGIESENRKTVVLDAQNGARVVQSNTVIDPRSRSSSVSLEYPSELGPSLIGSRFAAHVFSGDPEPHLAIPRSAVIDDAGQEVVYVQTGGETFARRVVILGVIDGEYVAVQSGVRPGERVVSKGAYYVKLAAASGDAIGHGHAH